MTLPQQQFLELLKSGLWGTSPDLTLFTDNVNWEVIYKTASEQAVSGIIADGIEILPRTQFPPKDILTKFIMAKVHIRQMNLKMNSTLNEIVSILQNSSIRPILLKGQGVAQYYRNPESRSCGDIDLYIGPDRYNECRDILLKSRKISTENSEENFLHMGMKFNGIEVEIHRLAGYLKNPELDYRFQNWTKEALLSCPDELLPEWNNSNTPILLPEHTFNTFFLIQHIAKHITTEGIGFRQICDWVMFIYRNNQNIDNNDLKTKIQEFKITEIWDAVSSLAVEYLGLPVEYLPVKTLRKRSRKTEKLLNEIFRSGNFGHSDTKRKQIDSYHKYLKKKTRNILLQISRIFRIISLFPKYTIRYSFDWILGGIKHLCRCN